jgi:hypothetical protein
MNTSESYVQTGLQWVQPVHVHLPFTKRAPQRRTGGLTGAAGRMTVVAVRGRGAGARVARHPRCGA